MIKSKYIQTKIGMIPEDWDVKSLNQVANFTRGFSYNGSEKSKTSGEYVFVTLNSVKEGGGFKKEFSYITSNRLKERHFVIKKDIVIANTEQTKTGTLLGCPAFVEFPPEYKKIKGVFSHHITKATLNTNIIKNYLYYHLIYIQKNAVIYHTGSVIWALDVNSWSKKELIAIPPLHEQSAIAKILSDLDSKIELNQRMNETLETIGQAIFKRWFVDFEEIPYGWETKPLDEIADFLNGLALQKYPAKEGEEYLPAIKIRELRNGITEQTDKISLDLPKEYLVENGDILFSWSGSLEVVIWTNGRGALNQHLFKVSSKEYPKWFYYYWVKHHLPHFRHIAEGKATTMGHIQKHNLSESEILVPDKNVLDKIDKIMSPILNKIIMLRLEANNLAKIRDSLLPKLMSGRLVLK